jgi:integrase
MFSLDPQRARIGIKPYRDRTRPHLKWTLAGYYVNGKRVRKFFENKTDAETFARQIQVKAENLGSRAMGIDPKLHVMAIESHDILAPYGKTIADAARFYRDHLETVNRSCTVDELVTGFLQNKEHDGKSREYLRDLKFRLGRFQKAFGARTIATITTAESDDWLRAIRLSPLSRNNYRRVLSTLFAYAVARGYAPANPIPSTAKAKITTKPVEVLTPEQTKRLLEAADPDVLPSIAIAAFAGLRPAEISRLDWREVHLERSFIEVPASKSKTASRRLVTILPNLKAWLLPRKKDAGLVEPPNFRKKVDAARARAGFDRWPTNALRHSFASYHLAHWKDAPALALLLGHTTTAMLFAHYREVVTPQASGQYWTIMPPPLA